MASAYCVLYAKSEFITAVLVARKAKHMSNNPGQLVFPGGRREGGETDEDAALREFKEETSVTIDPATMQVMTYDHYDIVQINTVVFNNRYSATFVKLSLKDLKSVRWHIAATLSRKPGELVDVDVVTPIHARATFFSEHQADDPHLSTEWFSNIADRARTGFG